MLKSYCSVRRIAVCSSPAWDRAAGTDCTRCFRAALVEELLRRSPERVVKQQVSAARWFEDAGDVAVALEHWIRAGRFRDALRLLAAKVAELYDSGREATIQRVIAAIPDSVASEDLETMLQYAWCHLLVSRRRFLQAVEQLTRQAERAADADQVFRARLLMLQSIAAMMSGRWVESGELAQRALVEMGDDWVRDPYGRFAWNLVAREVALSEQWDDLSERVRAIDHALSRDLASWPIALGQALGAIADIGDSVGVETG